MGYNKRLLYDIVKLYIYIYHMISYDIILYYIILYHMISYLTSWVWYLMVGESLLIHDLIWGLFPVRLWLQAEAFLILFNSFVVGWETEWTTSNTQMNPTIKVSPLCLSSMEHQYCDWTILNPMFVACSTVPQVEYKLHLLVLVAETHPATGGRVKSQPVLVNGTHLDHPHVPGFAEDDSLWFSQWLTHQFGGTGNT